MQSRLRFSFGVKIFGLSTGLLILLIGASYFSYSRLVSIALHVRILSETLIPLIHGIDDIEILALEQEVHLERLLKLYEAQLAPAEQTRQERAAFEERGEKLEAALETIVRRMQTVHQDPAWLRMEQTLRGIGTEYREFHGHVLKAFAHRQAGGREKTLLTDEKLDAEAEDIHLQIRAIRDEMQKMLQESVLQTRAHQQRVLQVNTLVTFLACGIGILYASFLTGRTIRPIRRLMDAMRAVEQGNVGVQIQTPSRDEIGAIAHAFSDMVSQLALKEKIKNTFGKYVDPRVVENLIGRPEHTQTGGEKRTMTVLFTDIEGLGALTGHLPPDEQIGLINRYLTLVSGPVSDRKGVIDKFINTTVMAFWGPPFTDETSHARLACEAALAQLAGHEAICRTISDYVGPIDASRVKFHIGLSTGPLVVGNMGSEQSQSYTVLGDTVNTASRLKGASKQYGVQSLITEDTHALIAETIECREIDRIRVVGKEEPVHVLELLGIKGEVPAPALELRAMFEEGLRAYRARLWDGALQHFEACRKINAHDGPTAEYISRVHALRENPPDAGWDGVWHLTKK